MPDLRLIQIRRTSHVPNLMHKLCYRGGSRGKVQGVRTPPPQMTCGFLIQLVFCKKIYIYMWFIGEEQERSAPPPKNNSGLAPVLTYFSIKPRS